MSYVSGEVDYYRISNIILDEFRAAKIGRFTLETPIKMVTIMNRKMTLNESNKSRRYLTKKQFYGFGMIFYPLWYFCSKAQNTFKKGLLG